jgi:predicted ATPase/DNA-binding winged helix-turn-helix (wHTH) protein
VYRFGELQLDPAGRELRRAGAALHLEPLAFDLLVYLVEHRDRVVSKTELLDGVWGHRFTSEASLTTRVKQIRQAVGDDGRAQQTIRNVRGRGYRFVADLLDADARPARGLFFPLVGREEMLTSLVDLVAGTPLTTLVGPGGVGKSTLARAVRSVVAGGVECHMVELEPVGAGTALVPVVARALRIVADEDNPRATIDVMALRDALVILDNCDHVLDDVAALVDDILAAGERNVRMLATSQSRIGVSGEVVVSVDPLGPEHATALFHERARAASSAWDAGSVDASRVLRLVSRLDRLPLTIEMAAARLASVSFDDLEHAILQGAPLLQLTHRARAVRHRSLPSIVEWSAGLLDERLARVFRELSVFAGPVSASDAGAVLMPENPSMLLFDLAALSERSLLSATVDDGETRYRMLGTVSAVAHRWLIDSGSEPELSMRHAHHVRRVLDDVDAMIRTPDELTARRRLEAIADEARAAHAWAREHDVGLASAMSGALFHAAYTSLWWEPAEWSRLALDAAGPDPAAPMHGAALVAAAAAAHRGDHTSAWALAETAAAAPDARVLAAAAEVLADLGLYRGDFEAVRRWSAVLRRVGEQLHDSHALALSTIDVALASAYSGDPLQALRELDDVRIAGFAPTDAAWLAYAKGDALSLAMDASAAASFEQAIALGDGVGNRFVVSVSRASLAAHHTRSGDVRRAVDSYAAALDDHLRFGNLTHAVTTMHNLVGLLETLGDEDGAAALSAAMSRGSHVELGATVAMAAQLVDAQRC